MRVYENIKDLINKYVDFVEYTDEIINEIESYKMYKPVSGRL